MAPTIEASPPIYDRIGEGYRRHRQADPRIVDAVLDALGLPAQARLAEIGAGTGNYSGAFAARGHRVVAIEPSAVMRDQATPHERVEWLTGTAEALPLPDASVDGIVVMLAFHHFASEERALAEMARVRPGGPWLLFTVDPRQAPHIWFDDYFPTVNDQGCNVLPQLDELCGRLAQASGRPAIVRPFPLPHDLVDHFMLSGWRRPEIYLDPGYRASMSALALADPDLVARGLDRLRADLESGAWLRRNADLMSCDRLDLGYRLVVTGANQGG